MDIKVLRQKRDTLLDNSAKHSSAIADRAKLIAAGDTSEMIAQSLAKLQIMNRKHKETSFMIKLRAFMPFNSVEKVEEKVLTAAAEGSTVSEVTQGLMDAITTKRKAVEDIIEDLYDLADNITHTYNETKTLTDQIKEEIDNGVYEGSAKFHADVVLTELLEYQSIMNENRSSASNTIQAAEVSVKQIASLQPKLKAQLDDGLSILVALEELDKLATHFKDLDGLCTVIREDNRERAHEAQMKAIELYTVQKEDILRLESSSKKAIALQEDLNQAMLKATNSVAEKAEAMRRITEKESLQLSAPIMFDREDTRLEKH